MDNERKPLASRALILFGAFLLVAIMFIVRLFYLQLIRHEYYTKASLDQSIRTISLEGLHGILYDVNNVPLAYDYRDNSLYVNKRLLNKSVNLSGLCKDLNINYDSLNYKIISNKDSIILLKNEIVNNFYIDRFNKPSGINSDAFFFESYMNRVYPYRLYMSSILSTYHISKGYVFCLEKQFENLLQGRTKKINYVKDALGRLIYPITPNPFIENGKSLKLNIDFVLSSIINNYQNSLVRSNSYLKSYCNLIELNSHKFLVNSTLDYKKDTEKYPLYDKHLINDFNDYFAPGKAFDFLYFLNSGLLKENDIIYDKYSLNKIKIFDYASTLNKFSKKYGNRYKINYDSLIKFNNISKNDINSRDTIFLSNGSLKNNVIKNINFLKYIVFSKWQFLDYYTNVFLGCSSYPILFEHNLLTAYQNPTSKYTWEDETILSISSPIISSHNISSQGDIILSNNKYIHLITGWFYIQDNKYLLTIGFESLKNNFDNSEYDNWISIKNIIRKYFYQTLIQYRNQNITLTNQIDSLENRLNLIKSFYNNH